MTQVMTSSTIIDFTGQRIDLSSWKQWAEWWEAGLDMGSGISTVYLQPVKKLASNRIERGPIFRLSFPSVVASGEGLLEMIANGRNAPRNQPESKLSEGEFVLRMGNETVEHLVGDLAYLEGENPDDAKGDPDRYWGEHIKRIALTACAAIIPDRTAEVRLNFCMPFTLYSPERKEQAKANLDGQYSFFVNEHYHDFTLKVGTVIPEGFAAITQYGNSSGNNVSIDIGDRTTEIIFAKGFTLISRDSVGQTYGVRQVIDTIGTEIAQTYGRVLEVEEVRAVLKAYTAGRQLPRFKVAKGTADNYLGGDELQEIVERKIIIMARALARLIRKTLNREGAEIGSNLDTTTIYGGGGYIFCRPLRDGIDGDRELDTGLLKDLYLPPEAEYLNAAYCQQLVAQQTHINPTMWERKR